MPGEAIHELYLVRGQAADAETCQAQRGEGFVLLCGFSLRLRAFASEPSIQKTVSRQDAKAQSTRKVKLQDHLGEVPTFACEIVWSILCRDF